MPSLVGSEMCIRDRSLGKKTFAPGALNMAKKGGKIAAVPVDGWTQMVVYRKDLFAAAGLEPPTSYANIVKAVNALSSNDMFGFVAATNPNISLLDNVLTAFTIFAYDVGGSKPAFANRSFL